MPLTDIWSGWTNAGDVPPVFANGAVSFTDADTTLGGALQLAIPGVLGGSRVVLEVEARVPVGEARITASWVGTTAIIGEHIIGPHAEYRKYRLECLTRGDTDFGTLFLQLGTIPESIGTASFRRPVWQVDAALASGVRPAVDGSALVLANGIPFLGMSAAGKPVAADGSPLGNAVEFAATSAADLPFPVPVGFRIVTDGRDGIPLAVGDGKTWRLPDGRLALFYPQVSPLALHTDPAPTFAGRANPGATVTIALNIDPPSLARVNGSSPNGADSIFSGVAAPGSTVTLQIDMLD